MRETKRKVLTTILTIVMFVSTLPMMETEKVQAAEDYGIRNPRAQNGVTTWDCVYFGSYWQNDTNRDGAADKNDEKQPIKWRVLSVDGDDAFLLSDKNLDAQYYNKTHKSVTWETCTLRGWMNKEFVSYAFSYTEQAAIQDTIVVNENNSKYGTEGGNDTIDKVYLLSDREIVNPAYGFTLELDQSGNKDATNTAYVAHGGEINTSWMRNVGEKEVWWLRTPWNDGYNVSIMYEYGYVPPSSDYRCSSIHAVRPVLHLNLAATSTWSYAGTVSSRGASWEPQNANEKLVKVEKLCTKAKKKSIYVKWKKVTGAMGYEIHYSTTKKFKKKTKRLTKKTVYTIKKMKRRNTYFVRVRAYTVQGGKVVYGKWSKVKRCKVR